jgi:hypothetical protein
VLNSDPSLPEPATVCSQSFIIKMDYDSCTIQCANFNEDLFNCLAADGDNPSTDYEYCATAAPQANGQIGVGNECVLSTPLPSFTRRRSSPAGANPPPGTGSVEVFRWEGDRLLTEPGDGEGLAPGANNSGASLTPTPAGGPLIHWPDEPPELLIDGRHGARP